MRYIICTALVFLSSWAHALTELPCSQSGQSISISGSNTLPKKCQYFGELVITQSNTTLDCQDATIWGLPSALRARTANMSPVEFRSAVQDANNPIKPLRLAIFVKSATKISNIIIKNCNINAFQQAIRIQHADTATTWLWNMVKADPILDGPYNNYKNSPNNTAYKTALLNALKAYDWDLSPLPSRIRDVTPQDVHINNVHVDLTHMVGVYIDHHVTHVDFNNSSVNRAGSAGMYLEFGSQYNEVINSHFTNNNREGIAIDSSAYNLVQSSEFTNNKNGGIYLYRNCWENFQELDGDNYFPRTQGSDKNRILQNNFTGNGSIDDDKVKDTGVWVASRQSETAKGGCGLYQMGQDPLDGKYYHEDQARNVEITGNHFTDIRVGIKIEDNGAKVLGNVFENSVDKAAQVGLTKPIRSRVLNATVRFNQIYQNAGTATFAKLVEIRNSSQTSICSTFGRAGVSVVMFDGLCSYTYLQSLRDSGYLDFFQPILITRINEFYPIP